MPPRRHQRSSGGEAHRHGHGAAPNAETDTNSASATSTPTLEITILASPSLQRTRPDPCHRLLIAARSRTKRPPAKFQHALAFENAARRSRESSARTTSASPICTAVSERPSRARQPSRRSLTPRAPETASTNATDLPIPLSSGMGRALMLADASSSRRCARSTTDADGRAPRAARRCRRRPSGRAAESAPVVPTSPAGHGRRTDTRSAGTT
jgi:hypothetical protein